MPLNLISKILNGEDEQLLKGSIVIDEASGKSFEDAYAELQTLKTAVSNFLTGEDDDNGALDRLKELVAQIEANKTSIEAITSGSLKAGDIVNDLTSGGATKVLSAEQGKALKELVDAIETHTHANASVLDGISKNTETGNLVFNEIELNGATGIAFVSSAAANPVYDGKVRLVVSAYNRPGEAAPEIPAE